MTIYVVTMEAPVYDDAADILTHTIIISRLEWCHYYHQEFQVDQQITYVELAALRSLDNRFIIIASHASLRTVRLYLDQYSGVNM
jgi:hypothetical protein